MSGGAQGGRKPRRRSFFPMASLKLSETRIRRPRVRPMSSAQAFVLAVVAHKSQVRLRTLPVL